MSPEVAASRYHPSSPTSHGGAGNDEALGQLPLGPFVPIHRLGLEQQEHLDLGRSASRNCTWNTRKGPIHSAASAPKPVVQAVYAAGIGDYRHFRPAGCFEQLFSLSRGVCVPAIGPAIDVPAPAPNCTTGSQLPQILPQIDC